MPNTYRMSDRSGFAGLVLSNKMSGGFVPIVVGDYESIATVNGTGSSNTVSFNSIPATFKHLQIRAIMRDTSAFNDSYGANLKLNSDAGTTYSVHNLIGNGTAASAGGAANQSNVGITQTAGGGMAANIYGVAIIDLLDYANTNKFKTVSSLTGVDSNSSVGFVSLQSANWRNTAAITQIDLTAGTANWSTLSHFALYGIK